jgi:hypothetical protein
MRCVAKSAATDKPGTPASTLVMNSTKTVSTYNPPLSRDKTAAGKPANGDN